MVVVYVGCLCGLFMMDVYVCLTNTEQGSLFYFKQIFQSLWDQAALELTEVLAIGH